MALVAVKGLNELRRALRDDSGLKNGFRSANFATGKVVLDAARPGIASESTGVAASGRAVRSTAGVRLSFSDVKSGGYLYGSHKDRPRVGPSGRRYLGYNQFPAFDREGRHVEPAVEENMEAIADVYMTELDRVFDRNRVPRA